MRERLRERERERERDRERELFAKPDASAYKGRRIRVE